MQNIVRERSVWIGLRDGKIGDLDMEGMGTSLALLVPH